MKKVLLVQMTWNREPAYGGRVQDSLHATAAGKGLPALPIPGSEVNAARMDLIWRPVSLTIKAVHARGQQTSTGICSAAISA
jgi:hypothetical protein